jgi:ATP-dependent DNA helicase RecQ
MHQWRHHELPTFGIGADLSDKEWRGVFRQMVALGLLSVDHAYGALQLTEASRPVLKGEQSVALRRQSETKKGATRRSRKIDAELSTVEHALWERLRAWRTDTAKTHGVPAYVILHDATLLELVRQRPQSNDALRRIPGIGAHKLENYGEALLGMLSE